METLFIILSVFSLYYFGFKLFVRSFKGIIDEIPTEKEIVQLTTFLPSTDKMYLIDYHEGTIIFVDNTNEVIEIPFGKLFIEKDRDKENVLIFNYAVKKNSDGEVLEKDCKELTVYQRDKEVDECSLIK